ncbi:hypothetical protein B4096_3084 [Heyndrickxia coagulans]|uniref:Uncharacterized protein n=1 Tax=Heyndrickxia coagulans TaxID=1398 RepID=A0A0C5C365_HEYCO|nr:hypothetical protein SB48_HM08orf03046 [Heyndrickxia coagulans]KYC60239.1 hypothetical protein B4098_2922 [Heyndrickxia coagulans]KYC87172.1 hypothetical protein B4096_3084 [Heyndrickxia coagulans]
MSHFDLASRFSFRETKEALKKQKPSGFDINLSGQTCPLHV